MTDRVNWLKIPDDMVYNIGNRFTRQRDLIRFSIVCHSWRSVYTDILHHRSPKLPLLMLPTELNQDDDQTRSFYSLTDNTVCNSKVPIPQNRHCAGSSHGWVLTVNPDFQISLINPFNRNEISLPSPDALVNTNIYHRLGFLRKVVLSINPELDSNYVILAIHGPCYLLAFYKPGMKAWTSLDSHCHCIVDAIRYQDQFYGVDVFGEVYAIDLDHTEPTVSKIAPQPPPRVAGTNNRYLVESSGDLLQILRYIKFGKPDNGDGDYDGGGDVDGINDGDYDDDDNKDDETPLNYFTSGFDVFKWDPIELEWIELNNLGDRMLFVGDNSSLCVSTVAFPECMPNSIYYTDDYRERYSGNEKIGIGLLDMGVFSFDDRKNRPLYPTVSKLINPPPIWIEPPV